MKMNVNHVYLACGSSMESMATLGVNATMEGFGRGCEDDEVPIGTRTVNFSVPGDNSLLPFCEALQV